MAGDPTIYTGEDATVYISGTKHTTLAISDFSLTLSKGTAEQELLGEKGNFYLAGAMSADGSLSACKLHNTAVGPIVGCMIDGHSVSISGNCGANSLHFYFASCQVTGFDFSIGTADDITEGTLDYTLLYPYKVSGVQHISAGGTYISDFGTYPN